MYSPLDIFSRIRVKTGGSDGCMIGSTRRGVGRAGVVVGAGFTWVVVEVVGATCTKLKLVVCTGSEAAERRSSSTVPVISCLFPTAVEEDDAP